MGRSAESRERTRQAILAYRRSERGKNHPKPTLGMKMSEETKEKIRAAALRRDPETRKHSQETKDKIAAANTRRRGVVKFSHAVKAKLSAIQKERHRLNPRSNETRLKLSLALKNNPKVIAHHAAMQASSPTSIERAVHQLLTVLNVQFIAPMAIGPYLADVFVPSKNLVIECDGDYWHTRPGAQERDRRKDSYYRASGYTIVRLWEHEIKAGRFDKLKEAVNA